MPAYLVTNRETGSRDLVVADTPAQALRFISERVLTVSTLKGEDVAILVAEGLAPQNARKAQKEMELTPPPAEPTTYLPMYTHKTGCAADPWTPIGQKDCRCMKLDIPTVM
jgi:hypothetical protein